jgi:hypothetical protein
MGMKLEELIGYLLDNDRLEELYRMQDIGLKSESILIYMKDSLTLNSEIVLFEIEETNDEIVYQKKETKYIQFFPIEYTISLIELDLNLKNKGYTNLEIAQKLLEYRENDA